MFHELVSRNEDLKRLVETSALVRAFEDRTHGSKKRNAKPAIYGDPGR